MNGMTTIRDGDETQIGALVYSSFNDDLCTIFSSTYAIKGGGDDDKRISITFFVLTLTSFTLHRHLYPRHFVCCRRDKLASLPLDGPLKLLAYAKRDRTDPSPKSFGP